MKLGIICGFLGLLTVGAPAIASPHELRLPLDDGRLDWADLSAAACEGIHLPSWHVGRGQISLKGWRGSLVLQALNASCGDGCRVTVSDNALVFHLDTEKLPGSLDQSTRALRTFVATGNPQATAAQARRFGLFLPARVDSTKNLVVLIHGLDCDGSMLRPMGRLLEARGVQVAYFCYPSDQPIEDDLNLLRQNLNTLHESFDGIRVDLIGHSMGGLIARAYVEGSDYRGDVDHLIMVGTPNGGSGWARLHLVVKAHKQYALSRNDPDWHWSWFFTEGLGEGARDVLPHSDFLDRLNAQPRRAGVRYTLIAGSHSAFATFEAESVRAVEGWAPPGITGWWGVRQLESTLEHKAEKLAESTGKSDGPVSVRSVRLAGVQDMVVLPADHCSLFVGSEQSPPAALPVILDRLGVSAAR